MMEVIDSLYHITTIDKDGLVLTGGGFWDHDELVRVLMIMGWSHYDEVEKEVFISEGDENDW